MIDAVSVNSQFLDNSPQHGGGATHVFLLDLGRVSGGTHHQHRLTTSR
jgi:hypothetical protein